MALRLTTEKFLLISEDLLFPKISVGLLLASLPKFTGVETLQQVFINYDIHETYADKKARRYWENEEFTGRFCANALVSKMPLFDNFKAVFWKENMVFLLDQEKKKGFFLAEKDNIVIATNYHRDALPKLLRKVGIVLWGSTIKINPVGWQNLYDLIWNDFTTRFPNIRRIEVISIAPGIRFASPVLQLEVALLNFSTPEKLRETIEKAIAEGTK